MERVQLTMQTLTYILNPYELDKFLAKYWTYKAILIPCIENKSFENLFSWDKLNYLLNFNDLDSSSLDLIIGGKVYQNNGKDEGKSFQKDSLIEFIQKGASLRFRNVHNKIPEICELVFNLKKEIDTASQIYVNAYYSGAGTQGFICHYDPHEVFILQIEGQKEWRVFEDTIIKYPLKSPKLPLPPASKEPYLTCTLNPGDVLYIPRGHSHYAIALEQASLHLTIAVCCSTGIDFLEWLVNRARRKQEWRKALPLAINNDLILTNSSVSLKEHLKELLQNLVDNIKDADIESEYIDYLNSLKQPMARYSLPYQVRINLFSTGSITGAKEPINSD
jgi:ribosomal protein L16 Arg81 hydroxylase